MRPLAALVLAALAHSPAHASIHGGSAYADGFAGAASGATIQHSTFFTGYANQSGQSYTATPPWKVAGVFYPTGVDETAAGTLGGSRPDGLRDVANATDRASAGSPFNAPTSCTYDNSASGFGKTVNCQSLAVGGAFNGWYFGDTNLVINPRNAVAPVTFTVTNSRFAPGSNKGNDTAINGAGLIQVVHGSCVNTVFTNDEFNNAVPRTTIPVSQYDAFITVADNGSSCSSPITITAKYNSFYGIPQRAIENDVAGPADIEFNYAEEFGQCSGGTGGSGSCYHASFYNQNRTSPYSASYGPWKVKFNTVLFTSTSMSGTGGITIFTGGDLTSSLAGANVSNNVIVMNKNPALQAATGSQVTAGNVIESQADAAASPAPLSMALGAVTFNTNYVDGTGTYYCTYPAPSGTGATNVAATGFQDNGAAGTSDSGVAGNTLHITAITNGGLTTADQVGGLAAGTFITALGTGVGGVGTYTVSGSPAHVASTAITQPRTLNYYIGGVSATGNRSLVSGASANTLGTSACP